jgi:integrase
LRVLLDYAVDQEMIDSNPATGVKRYRSRGDGIHTWSEEEIAQFESQHAVGTRARLALALLLYTAQRRGDVVRMGKQHISGDNIAVRQEKTDSPLLIPIHPSLARALASGAANEPHFPDDGARRALYVGRVRQLVQGSMQRGRLATMLGPWSAQGRSDTTGQCRVQQ